MSLNKMTLLLPMMKNVCVRVRACVRARAFACAAKLMSEECYSDGSQGARGKNPPHTHRHTRITPLKIYHYLTQRRRGL